MGMMKNYQLVLICVGADVTEQDAIEWALSDGWYKPVYNVDEDIKAIEKQLPKWVDRFKELCEENDRVNRQPLLELVPA
jgi:hypothetical protein